MRKQRFDVLPIANGVEVKKYFRTHTRNDYSNISQETITHRDVISISHTHPGRHQRLRTGVPQFLFSAQRPPQVGLISVVNLNCRQVKVYLFSLLSELEVRLGKFIATHLSEDELLKMTSDGKEQTTR